MWQLLRTKQKSHCPLLLCMDSCPVVPAQGQRIHHGTRCGTVLWCRFQKTILNFQKESFRLRCLLSQPLLDLKQFRRICQTQIRLHAEILLSLMFVWMHLDTVADAISLAYWWRYGTIVCTIVLARGSWSCSTDCGAFFKSVGRCGDPAWGKNIQMQRAVGDWHFVINRAVRWHLQ